MKVIFLGTPPFAASVLKKITDSSHQVVAVVTQPDKVNARGNKVICCAAKAYAQSVGLPVYQFQKISNNLDVLQGIEADIMVTAAYGQILSQAVLDCKKHGVINAHASLLPKYRGSSPVQWALINGEAETGVSVMQTVLEVDAGDVILTKKMSLDGIQSADDALTQLAEIAGDAVCEALDRIEEGSAVFVPQNHAEATHVRFLTKADGRLDFGKTAQELYNFVRGVTPWPSAYTQSPLGVLKLIKVQAVDCDLPAQNGEIVSADVKQGLIIKCAKGALSVQILQAEGSRAMAVDDFLRGKNLPVGTVLS